MLTDFFLLLDDLGQINKKKHINVANTHLSLFLQVLRTYFIAHIMWNTKYFNSQIRGRVDEASSSYWKCIIFSWCLAGIHSFPSFPNLICWGLQFKMWGFVLEAEVPTSMFLPPPTSAALTAGKETQLTAISPFHSNTPFLYKATSFKFYLWAVFNI